MVLLVLLCASAIAVVGSASTPGASLAPGTGVELRLASNPQALPNDGRSEAEITATLLENGHPLAGVPVEADVMAGGGTLTGRTATTDKDGAAHFHYRAGMMPEAGRVDFAVPDRSIKGTLSIPIASIAYLDIQLVSPEEYKAYLARQAAAAPIYKLSVDGFPGQLAADGASMSVLHAELTTTDGKPVRGAPLTIKLVSGEGQLVQDAKATDTGGRLSFAFIAGRTPGTAIIQVMEPSTGLVASFDIILVEAGPARVELYYRSPLTASLAREGAIMPADGMAELPVTAKVVDLLGLPVAGAELRVEMLDQVNGWVEVRDPVSDAMGIVQITYHAGALQGRVRLRAYIAAMPQSLAATLLKPHYR